MSPDAIPPAPLRRHTFGTVETLAAFAKHIDGTPSSLYTFGARWVQFPEYRVDAPRTVDEDDPWHTGYAWYDSDTETIVHFLEALHEVPPAQHAAQFTVAELHELTHWAIPAEDNPPLDDETHWRTWNRVLGDVVADHFGIDEWQTVEYEPPEASPQDDPQPNQTTLSEVL
jgi:hypothetical protein